MKWLLNYLKGTYNVGLLFNKDKEGINLKGFIDSDFADSSDNRKSTSAYAFTLNNTCIS